MSTVYMYVVARDFGFAPNPFDGVCTLATCKPIIRRIAEEGDWVIGMGGAALNALGRCVFAMQVTATMTFEEYWADPDYRSKRPSRNGSRKAMVGDNIYHRVDGEGAWLQEDSHHSRPDGTPDTLNVELDTGTNRVLLSKRFLYFGETAPVIPVALLRDIGFGNGRGHRTFDADNCAGLLEWLTEKFAAEFNMVSGDPFQFKRSNARYSPEKNRVIP